MLRKRDLLLIQIAAILLIGGSANGTLNPAVRQIVGVTETVNRFNGLGAGKDLNCATLPAKKLASVGELGKNRPRLSRDFYANGANCEGFIQRDGTYGEWGRIIQRGFEDDEEIKAALVSEKAAKNKSLLKICPNFEALDESDRIRFWVWSMASIAWKESTCRNTGPVRCSRSNCIGLMQLNEPRSMRYWRGSACAVASVAQPRNNLLCAMDIMRGQFEGEYGKPGGLSPYSYWQELRKSGKSPIKSRMMNFPGCRKSTLKAQRGGSSNERRTI
jgi:hypothetical protein